MFAGTWVYNQISIPGVYDIQGRYSSFVVHSFVLDLNHLDQRNNFCLQKVKYSFLQIWWLHWGIDICISCFDLPQYLTLVQIQAPYPTLFSQICYLTWWILVWNFQIWIILTFYALFYSQSISLYLDLVFFWIDLSFSFMFWIYIGNRAYAVCKKWCHRLNLVSSTRCHHLSPIREKRC